jgi:putative transcriptional regulator
VADAKGAAGGKGAGRKKASRAKGSQLEPTRIRSDLTRLLEERQMTLTRLSEEVGVSVTNLSLLKNDHVRAIRYSTLEAICEALDCQPGDLLRFEADQ